MLHCRGKQRDHVRIYADEQMIVDRRPLVRLTTPTDRVRIRAVHRDDPSIALRATVTVTDTGPACDYTVRAASTG